MGRKAELKQMRVEEREADGRDPRGEYPARAQPESLFGTSLQSLRHR